LQLLPDFSERKNGYQGGNQVAGIFDHTTGGDRAEVPSFETYGVVATSLRDGHEQGRRQVRKFALYISVSSLAMALAE
jgi:hypothetical protein